MVNTASMKVKIYLSPHLHFPGDTSVMKANQSQWGGEDGEIERAVGRIVKKWGVRRKDNRRGEGNSIRKRIKCKKEGSGPEERGRKV